MRWSFVVAGASLAVCSVHPRNKIQEYYEIKAWQLCDLFSFFTWSNKFMAIFYVTAFLKNGFDYYRYKKKPLCYTEQKKIDLYCNKLGDFNNSRNWSGASSSNKSMHVSLFLTLKLNLSEKEIDHTYSIFNDFTRMTIYLRSLKILTWRSLAE